MPKKMVGMNSKAVAAKARKEERSEAERSRKEKEEQEILWKDDDKSVLKKKERKEEQEKKRAELLQKKQERQRLVEEEEAALKAKPGKVPPPTKLTREEIRIKQAAKPAKPTVVEPTHLEQELPENLNRLQVTENEARTIDEAIDILGQDDEPEEKHPEKRMKAAYEEFENVRLPELKAENPSLRLSQLKQLLRKEWMKHPDNPFNKTISDYNSKK